VEAIDAATHLDAPLHFASDGLPTDRIPLENLVGDAVVINISKQAAADRNYRLTVDDVLSFEKQHGRIRPGAIVLLRTGWSRFWPDAEAYLGDDTPGDAGNLEFPSYGADAARFANRSAPGPPPRACALSARLSDLQGRPSPKRPGLVARQTLVAVDCTCDESTI
jgi:hypothetical protein